MSPSRSLTLMLPGLLGPLPRDLLRAPEILDAAPSLAWLLSKGRALALTARDREAHLAACFELSEPSVATGPVSLYGEERDPGDDFWFRADPVHLRADRDTLVLLAPDDVEVTRDEANQLVGEFNRFFADEGWRLEAPHPQRWYLRVDTPPALHTTPLDAVAGRSVEASLPAGPDARRWRVLLNEAQMLLHGHPVNGDRDARGLPPINGIWVWGGGRLPKGAGNRRWRRVYSDDPFVRGLARLNLTEVSPIPEAFDSIGADDGSALVVDQRMAGYLRRDDFAAWVDFLMNLERAWFVPLIDALRAGAIDSLCVDAGNGANRFVKGSDFHRFWRRARGLEHWIRTL